MKTLTRQVFVNMNPDVRRENFVGHVRNADGSVTVYERGLDEDAYEKAVRKIKKEPEADTLPENDGGLLADAFGDKPKVVVPDLLPAVTVLSEDAQAIVNGDVEFLSGSEVVVILKEALALLDRIATKNL